VAALPEPSPRSDPARSLAIPILAAAALIAILYLGRLFFITAFIAVMLAFMLEPFVSLLLRIRFPRPLASFFVCTIALLLLYLIGLGAYTQLSGLLGDVPRYSQRIAEIVATVQQKVEAMEKAMYQIVVPARQRRQEPEKQATPPPSTRQRNRRLSEPVLIPPPPPLIQEVRILEESSPIRDYFYARISSFYQLLLMASFVPFLVYFMLSWRDHIHRSFLQFFKGGDRMVAAKSLQGIADMIRAFVVGNFVLGIFLALVSSLAFYLIRLPYPLLVGPLSGFLSLLPYIGLPLAIIPPVFVALATVTTVSGYILVIAIVALLHLLALNLLYPKIVGSRVHLNPLVVTFSLMMWGFLWDAAGLLLAIPLTAGIKAVCDNVQGLRPFGKFLGD